MMYICEVGIGWLVEEGYVVGFGLGEWEDVVVWPLHYEVDIEVSLG